MTEEPEYTRRYRLRLGMMVTYLASLGTGLGSTFLGNWTEDSKLYLVACACNLLSASMVLISFFNLYSKGILTPPGTRPLKEAEIAQRQLSFTFLYLSALTMPLLAILVDYSNLTGADVGWGLVGLYLGAVLTLLLGVWASGGMGGKMAKIGEGQP